ncbi:MAG: NUDIX domain-containing protein [Micavibrio sp.]|nr:NUDIX domain-containing protein [Micavibrio sp.]
MENLDIFDELFNPLEPASASIDDVHKKGLWHQTFACWIVNPQKETVLFQLRGARNRIDPGSFDASSSGHLKAGESPADGFRELREELGIDIPVENRRSIGMFRNIAIRENYINREFCHVFLARSDKPLADFKLQEGEVAGIFEVEIEDAIKLFTKKVSQAGAFGFVRRGNKYASSEKTMRIEDACNWHERCEVSNYYLKVMLSCQGFLRGNEIIRI